MTIPPHELPLVDGLTVTELADELFGGGMATNFKTVPKRNKAYMKYITRQPCCLTGVLGNDWLGVDAHHQNKPSDGATGAKCCDSRCVPIRHDIHARMESPGSSRKEVWEKYGRDPEEVIRQMQERWISDGNPIFWEGMR